jgi:hypothetical protein
VTSTLLGGLRLPDWYFSVQYWADGLSTAYFALLAPAAMGCIAAAILMHAMRARRSAGGRTELERLRSCRAAVILMSLRK